MPNFIGGKNYKKTKHVSETTVFVEKEDDQLYGRVIQVLGNRNTLVFCNDNIVRLCHIRGSIRKDMWISVGDIVIVSIRDFLREKNDLNIIFIKDLEEIQHVIENVYIGNSKHSEEELINLGITQVFNISKNHYRDYKIIKENKFPIDDHIDENILSYLP